jgi:hypothetical protein
MSAACGLGTAEGHAGPKPSQKLNIFRSQLFQKLAQIHLIAEEISQQLSLRLATSRFQDGSPKLFTLLLKFDWILDVNCIEDGKSIDTASVIAVNKQDTKP